MKSGSIRYISFKKTTPRPFHQIQTHIQVSFSWNIYSDIGNFYLFLITETYFCCGNYINSIRKSCCFLQSESLYCVRPDQPTAPGAVSAGGISKQRALQCSLRHKFLFMKSTEASAKTAHRDLWGVKRVILVSNATI